MMLSIRGLYQILAYVYEIINAYSIKSLMVVPFMNLLKSTLSQYHANVRFRNQVFRIIHKKNEKFGYSK